MPCQQIPIAVLFLHKVIKKRNNLLLATKDINVNLFHDAAQLIKNFP